ERRRRRRRLAPASPENTAWRAAALDDGRPLRSTGWREPAPPLDPAQIVPSERPIPLWRPDPSLVSSIPPPGDIRLPVRSPHACRKAARRDSRMRNLSTPVATQASQPVTVLTGNNR